MTMSDKSLSSGRERTIGRVDERRLMTSDNRLNLSSGPACSPV